MGGERDPRPATSKYPILSERPVGKKIENIYTDR